MEDSWLSVPAGAPVGVSMANKELRYSATVEQADSPSRRYNVAREAEASRRETEERIAGEQARLAAFQRATLQRATLKVAPAAPAPVVVLPTEFEIALREANANNSYFSALMHDAPLIIEDEPW